MNFLPKALSAFLFASLFCVPATSFAQPTIKNTLTLRPDAAAGKDVAASSYSPATNHATTNDFIAAEWTVNGDPMTVRSFIEFDMSSLPANATIDTVYLSLYCNTTSTNAQLHSFYPGSPYTDTNRAYLRRITSAWTETGVTWNNQPTSTTTNQLILPYSTSNTQDYLNINVTQLAKDAVASGPDSLGLMIQLVDEVIYRSLIFATSDHPDSTKRPKLVIKYSVPNAVSDIENLAGVQVYPNPAVNQVSVSLQDVTGVNNISIIDMTGRVIETAKTIAPVNHFNVEAYPNGLYFIKIDKGETKSTYKFIIKK